MDKSDKIAAGLVFVAVGLAALISGTQAAIVTVLVGIIIILAAHRKRHVSVNATIGNVGAEWGYVVYGFNALLGKGLMAQWDKSPEGIDEWHIRNGSEADKNEIQALNLRAGKLLLYSKKMTIDPSIKAKTDDIDRWLSYVRYVSNIGPERTIEVSAGGIIGTYGSGIIQDLARMSKTAASGCETRERF